MDALAAIEQLGATIKARVEKGDKDGKDSDNYLAAGLHLLGAIRLVGKRVVYDLGDLDAWLASNRVANDNASAALRVA